MMRVAVFDLGSNSFHVLVVDADRDGSLAPLLRRREMPRLGAVVARHGTIPARDLRSAVATVGRLRQLAESAKADAYVAVATSALRDAGNGREVLAALSDRLEVPVQLLDGEREAELAFRGVRASVALPAGPAVMFDLGGGSLDVAVGDGSGRSVWSASLAIGTARLAGELVSHDPVTAAERDEITRAVADRLRPVVATVRDRGGGPAVVVGGAPRAVAKIVAVARWRGAPRSLNQMTITADEIRGVVERLDDLTLDERLDIPGMKSRRADLLPVATTILATLVDELDLPALVVSDWGLREGIVLDTVGATPVYDAQELRERAVARLAGAWRPEPDHADEAAVRALRAFERVRTDAGLDVADGELLAYAARLHGIGRTVSLRGHHKHAAYLIEHANLRGFSPEEVAALASIVRYQKSGEPSTSFEPFARLPQAWRRRVTDLSALLQHATRMGDVAERRFASLRRGPEPVAV